MKTEELQTEIDIFATDSEQIKHHKLDIVKNELEFKHDNTWQSCCFQADKRFVTYIVQILFMIALFVFCVNRIVFFQGECSDQTVYIGLISGLIGWVLPSPTIASKAAD